MLALTNLVGLGRSGLPPVAVTLDGTVQDNASSSTRIYTVVGTIPVGALVVLAAADIANNHVTGVVDSRGNTYSVDNANDGRPNFASALVTTQLIAGDTITVTWSSSATGHVVTVASVNNGQAGAADQQSVSSGTSNSLSSGATAATVQSNEVAFGMGAEVSTNAMTEDGAFTNLAQLNYGAGSRAIFGYRVLTAVGAQTYAPTTTGTPAWTCAISTYKVPT